MSLTIVTTITNAGNRSDTEYKVEIKEGEKVLAEGRSTPSHFASERARFPTSEKAAALLALQSLRHKLREAEAEMKKCGFLSEEGEY